MSIAADKLHLLDFSDVTVRGRRLRARHPGLLLAGLRVVEFASKLAPTPTTQTCFEISVF